MARLAGVDLPRDKRMEVALTIYGIGRTRSKEILNATGIGYDLRTKDPDRRDLVALRSTSRTNFRVEGDLRREVQADIRRKIEIGCYRGSGTAEACRCAASGPRPTPAAARVEEDRRRQEEGR
jgi:small subunit ribosomal protein S13